MVRHRIGKRKEEIIWNNIFLNSSHYAIKKYGWNNIEHKIIKTNLSQEDALNLERELIRKYNLNNIQKRI